jgi:tetratricopeptide (TPR) repeat protein
VIPPDDDIDDEHGIDDEADDQDGDASDEKEPDEPETGYLWTFNEQEERLPDEFPTHMEILDEMEAGEILDLDLARAGDYLLWAAAQSLEEQGWTSQAIDLLKRIDAGTAAHEALSYPEIRLRLHDLLRERGDYEQALAILDRVERDDPDRKETCRERRAEVLVLTGRVEEGLRLFEAAVRDIPDDPWVPLAAAWALIRAGDYDGALSWIARGERAARRLEDEPEIRAIDSEVERLQTEARIRHERQLRLAAAADAAAKAAATAAAAPAAEGPASTAPHPVGSSTGEAASHAAPGAAAPDGPSPAVATAAEPAAVAPEAAREAVLAELDAEEVRLTRNPPRTEADREAAVTRLAALHRRASSAWDDAVERHDEQAIAIFDDLQWEVVEVAERFGLRIPGVED